MVERKQESGSEGLGFCCFGGLTVGPQGFMGSLFVNLKHKSRNLMRGKRKKTSGPNGQLSKSTKIFERSFSGERRPGCVAGNVFILLH